MATVFFGIANRSFVYDRTLGRQEFSGAGFRAPSDLALGPNGTIYVVNRSWEYRPDGVRVTVLNIEEELLGEFSRRGEGDGELYWPSSIAVDSSQNVYVADDWLNRISVFDKDGEFLSKWGTGGSGDGQISKPCGLTFDSDDNLLVADAGNNRVQKFSKDGKLLAKWGEAGSSQGQINVPWGLTIDSRGDVYVADWRNDRIQKFTPDGKFLAEYGSSGNGPGQFNRPSDVAVDKDGDIYVCDWGNDRVQVITPEGKHVTTFTGDAGLSKWGREKLAANPDMIRQRNLMRDSSAERAFWRPKAVEVDDAGRILILDGYRGRIQVYRKED